MSDRLGNGWVSQIVGEGTEPPTPTGQASPPAARSPISKPASEPSPLSTERLLRAVELWADGKLALEGLVSVVMTDVELHIRLFASLLVEHRERALPEALMKERYGRTR